MKRNLEQFSFEEQFNLLQLAFLRKQMLCAGYGDEVWMGGREGVMRVIRKCSICTQSLLVTRRINGNGYASVPGTDLFLKQTEERAKMGIEMFRGPRARRRAACIESRFLIANDWRLDPWAVLKWKIEDNRLIIRLLFNGADELVANESMEFDKGQVILKILMGERSIEKFLEEKKLSKKEKIEQLKKEKNFDEKRDKYIEPTFNEIQSDIYAKFNSLNKKIEEVISSHLNLDGIPDKASWAYKFNTQKGRVGVGTFLKIEKE